MKKRYRLMTGALSAGVLFATFGAMPYTSAEPVVVEIDGERVTFDVNPEIIDGRTMVPVRRIFEEIGASVKWDSETGTIYARKNSKTITLSLDSAQMSIDKGKTDENGNPVVETVELDVPPQIISGRALVPARVISESFGLDVDWEAENNRVVIKSSEDDDSWKENIGTINLTDLSFEGDGIETDGSKIVITAGGDYTLCGSFDDGNIVISTEERVKIRLSGVSLTASEGACIYAENADKVYITVTENTKNTLVAENSEDGAIYSKENLEIKGKGALGITSKTGHGIKSSDNLTIENGDIIISAASDGIHVKDTFKMTDGAVKITCDGDGIASESIVDISGGELDIKTEGVPVVQSDETDGFFGAEKSGDVEFEKSSKGIKADWLLGVTGGKITVNAASHAVHCSDEIEISGGEMYLSSEYEKGISAHGNLTVSGSETVIDISKSTEGIESKNILTINDGTINIVSSDDGINATGGNSGAMPGGGRPMGQGMRNDEKEVGEMNRPPQESGDAAQKRQNGEPGGGRGHRNGPGGNMTPPELPNGDMMPPEMPGGGISPPEMPENGGGRPGFDRTDEAQNFERPADGGNMPGGGRGDNMKDCLVINGGNIEICAEDDCLDSNGNMIINGGTIKATNPGGTFYGAFAVIDPDGGVTIGEDAALIFAAGSGDARSLGLLQNTIIVNCEDNHGANEKITVSDDSGNAIFEYIPQGDFKSVLISSKELVTGKSYTVTVGDETYEVKISEQITTVGTERTFGRREEG